MTKAAKRASRESSASGSTSFGMMRKGIKQMTDRGVEFEVSANGSLRVRPSTYDKYLKLDRKTK